MGRRYVFLMFCNNFGARDISTGLFSYWKTYVNMRFMAPQCMMYFRGNYLEEMSVKY